MGSRTMGLRTTDWRTANVGGACLFEKPRSGARNIPRFSDITSDDDDCTYDANCDSGTWNATKNQWQLGNNDDSAYCTDET
jgi:hypothetical protein